MEKYRLSFAHVNVLDTHIAEVICDKNIEVTMEMIEEVEVFLCDFFVNDFGVLINKIHPYTYSFGAKLTLGSRERMKAIASVNYTDIAQAITQDIINIRSTDNLNIKQFSGLELGRQQAFEWLQEEFC